MQQMLQMQISHLGSKGWFLNFFKQMEPIFWGRSLSCCLLIKDALARSKWLDKNNSKFLKPSWISLQNKKTSVSKATETLSLGFRRPQVLINNLSDNDNTFCIYLSAFGLCLKATTHKPFERKYLGGAAQNNQLPTKAGPKGNVQ